MSIRDVGWRIFLNMLDYKSKLYGKIFVTVALKNTTQTCSACGFDAKKARNQTLNPGFAMVDVTGLEPVTFRTSSERSSQLS